MDTHGRPLITAHAGCDGTAENSLESIKKGIELGADCVEIDVLADAAGRLWLTHDLPEDFTGLVPLEEAFALIKESGIAVNCDLKEYALLRPTLELAEKCGIGREQLIFSGSVDPGLLEEDPEIARRCRIFLNSEELVKDLLQRDEPDRPAQTAFFLGHPDAAAARLQTLGAEALNAPYKHMPQELLKAFADRGIALSLWTVDEPEAMRELMKKDILNITTRRAAEAVRVREALRTKLA